MDYLSVSDAARELNVKPRILSDLLYHRVLRDDVCPIIGGRRLIPRSYLPIVENALMERGIVKPNGNRD